MSGEEAIVKFYPSARHGFIGFPPSVLGEAGKALEDMKTYIQKCIAGLFDHFSSPLSKEPMSTNVLHSILQIQQPCLWPLEHGKAPVECDCTRSISENEIGPLFRMPQKLCDRIYILVLKVREPITISSTSVRKLLEFS